MPRLLPAAALLAALALFAAIPSAQEARLDFYTSIDGAHLKGYVEDLAAISRAYRDHGHPQFWGRISGTEADAANAAWLQDKFTAIGLSDVHQQAFPLPPQWMPQSWSVSASAGSASFALDSAQPTYRGVATPAGGLDLEAVDVGFATDADLAAQDLQGKAVFFYSTDYQSRHATISNRAVKRISDKGAAAIFITLLIPGNLRFQFYPVGAPVPTFALGLDDGMRMRDLITTSRHAGQAARVKLSLDVQMTPDLRTSTVWGTVRGTSDETVYVVAHRDGWFEGANDNGTGVATMLGLAEYFAGIPEAERGRTIVFLGTSGHHDGTAASVSWLLEHKAEAFAKTALLINCEHTAADLLVASNGGVVRKAAVPSPLLWYIGGSSRLEEIVTSAYAAFGVSLMADRSSSAAGEIGRIQNLVPSMQLIDTGLYWHSDHETPAIVPADGLTAVTRAYAQIISETNRVPIADLKGM